MPEQENKREYYRCLRCGRALKNPEYRLRGFGKVCWEKVQHRNKRKLI